MDTDPRLDPRICALETGTSKTIRTAIAQRPRIKQIIAPPGFLIVKLDVTALANREVSGLRS